jgi:hypothetical protein
MIPKPNNEARGLETPQRRMTGLVAVLLRNRQSITCASSPARMVSSRDRNRSCSPLYRSFGRMAVPHLPRSHRARRNHACRFEGIAKSILQANDIPQAENLQIRLLYRPQLVGPFNGSGVLRLANLNSPPEVTPVSTTCVDDGDRGRGKENIRLWQFGHRFRLGKPTRTPDFDPTILEPIELGGGEF